MVFGSASDHRIEAAASSDALFSRDYERRYNETHARLSVLLYSRYRSLRDNENLVTTVIARIRGLCKLYLNNYFVRQ
jgi:hypothetical protein